MLGISAILDNAMHWRGPVSKTLSLVLGSVVFFFFNLSVIYYFVQKSQSAASLPAVAVQSAADSAGAFCVLDERNELAKSALARAKSDSCRSRIEAAACRLQNNTFHDVMPLSGCHNYDGGLAGTSMGCFLDLKKRRQLKGHDVVFASENSRARCENHCYRAGYLYYGVEYGKECFCGDDFDAQYVIDKSRCLENECSGNSSETCGGYEAIDIFRTGLIIKAAQLVHRPVYVEPKTLKSSESTVRILFLLQLNGRNVRQVRRLLKTIYSPKHFYYVHVDKRQLYMINNMRELATKLPNIYVERDGRSTIWGGASLLEMVSHTIRVTTSIPQFADWDYLVNMSESDFPVLTLAELEAQLTVNKGFSFLASHGHNPARFIQKQGFDFVFVECDERMWRVGKRAEFPRGLRIDGGSDWVILHKEFALYSVSDDELPTKLRKLFSSIILPVESFFHTLAANSMHCDHVLTANLRLTNWNRKQGCRCASLKKVVDWCGCSPLVFTKDTTNKFELERAKDKVYYLARKFENLIDVDAIAAAEEQAMRDRTHLLSTDSASFNTSHVNLYEAAFDGYSEGFTMIAKRLFSLARFTSLSFGSLRSIHVYREYFEANWQLVFSVLTNNGQTVELLVQRVHDTYVDDRAVVDGFSLKHIRIGTHIDHKEEIFRGYTGYIDINSSPTVLLQWERVPDTATSVAANKTSPNIKFEWRDASDALVAIQTLKPYDSIFGQQFAELVFSSLKRLRPDQTGAWSVSIIDDTRVIGKAKFPVFDPAKEEALSKLVGSYYRLVSACKSAGDCSSQLWSTFHPDPKSDIITGYNDSLKFLV